MKERPPTAEEYRAKIAVSKQRLSDLEERGFEALSQWDQTLGKVMSDGVESVLSMSKMLVTNHISYDGQKLAELEGAPRQMTLFQAPADH